MRIGSERCVSETRDLALNTANIGDNCARFEPRRDLADERYDSIDRCCDQYQVSVAHRIFGRIGDGVAPRLFAQRKARFRPPRPKYNSAGSVAGSSGESGGTA
jgi:hypothetical protein